MYLLTKEQIIPTLLLLLSRHSTLFLLLVVSSNASDWGCLTLVRETWGREIQNGRRLTVFWCRPCEFSLPNNRKSAFFVFSPLLIPIGVTSRSCRQQQQQQWRCFIQSGSLVYSWPVLTQEEGKKRKKGLERLGLAIWHWWNKQGLGSQLFCCFFHLEGPATLFTTPTPPLPFLPLFEIFFSFFLNFPRKKMLVCVHYTCKPPPPPPWN